MEIAVFFEICIFDGTFPSRSVALGTHHQPGGRPMPARIHILVESSSPVLGVACALAASAQTQTALAPIAGRIVASGVAARRPPCLRRTSTSERTRAAHLLDGKLPAADRQEMPWGSDGFFRFPVPGEPHFRLVVTEGDLRFEREVRGFPGRAERLEIPAAERLEGRVTDGGGSGVAGAVVYLDKPELHQIAPWKLGPSER